MTLRCKEGDLAFLIGTGVKNDGLIVHVVAPWHGGKYKAWNYVGDGPGWIVKVAGNRPIRQMWHGKEILTYDRPMPDCQLHPIRDNPGEDETLTWAPRKEPVPA